jgi:hypothetical protein
MSTEQQEEQQEFNRLLELAFIRKERFYWKGHLKHEEYSIKRITRVVDLNKSIKRQLSYARGLEYRRGMQVLADRRQKRNQIIKKIIIAIILIYIALLFLVKYFL